MLENVGAIAQIPVFQASDSAALVCSLIAFRPTPGHARYAEAPCIDQVEPTLQATGARPGATILAKGHLREDE